MINTKKKESDCGLLRPVWECGGARWGAEAGEKTRQAEETAGGARVECDGWKTGWRVRGHVIQVLCVGEDLLSPAGHSLTPRPSVAPFGRTFHGP